MSGSTPSPLARWRRLVPARVGRVALCGVLHVPILIATGVISGGAIAAAVDGWLDAGAALLIVAAGLPVAVRVWWPRRTAQAAAWRVRPVSVLTGETCERADG